MSRLDGIRLKPLILFLVDQNSILTLTMETEWKDTALGQWKC